MPDQQAHWFLQPLIGHTESVLDGSDLGLCHMVAAAGHLSAHVVSSHFRHKQLPNLSATVPSSWLTYWTLSTLFFPKVLQPTSLEASNPQHLPFTGGNNLQPTSDFRILWNLCSLSSGSEHHGDSRRCPGQCFVLPGVCRTHCS